MQAQQWPIDYNTLNKGDTIPVERVVKIVGKPETHSQYSLAALALAKRIETDLATLGRPVTIKYTNGSLRVLTDSEASEYNHGQVQRHRRGMLRRHWQTLAVDTTALTDDQRRQHERFIEVDSKYIQAIKTVDAGLRLEANKRSVPGRIE